MENMFPVCLPADSALFFLDSSANPSGAVFSTRFVSLAGPLGLVYLERDFGQGGQ